ncbi:MAG: hypothetical protein WCA08_15725, partial [Desulfoferrobacter sp.]
SRSMSTTGKNTICGVIFGYEPLLGSVISHTIHQSLYEGPSILPMIGDQLCWINVPLNLFYYAVNGISINKKTPLGKTPQRRLISGAAFGSHAIITLRL